MKKSIFLAFALCAVAMRCAYASHSPIINSSPGVTTTQAAAAAPVQTVAGRTGSVVLSHSDITDWSSVLGSYALSASLPTISSLGALSAANNLSDLASPATARTNLGLAAIGTSGAAIPLLNGANTWSGVQVFTNSDLALLGSSTGTTTLSSANSISANYVATVPGATDTIVELTQPQTLTNKTLTTPNVGTALKLASSTVWLSTTPTITTGFGTGDAISQANGSEAWVDTVGSSPTSSATFAMPSVSNGWACYANDITTPGSYVIRKSGGSTTTLILTSYSATAGTATAPAASDKIEIACWGH
jgi:hypothetical protein